MFLLILNNNNLMIVNSPIVGNNHLKDQTLYTWRNGDIKKNTPVAWSISKVVQKSSVA